MNVRLKDELFFTAGVFFENRLHMNNYAIRVNMITNTSDGECINVARDRMKWFVRGHLQNSVFLIQENKEKIKDFTSAELPVITFPEEPIDQIVGLMLYCKINSIMERYIIVTDIEVSSDIGDGCWFPHSQEESVGPFSHDGWWNSKDPSTHTKENSKHKRVVKLHETNNWHDLELDWPIDDSVDATITPFNGND